MKKDRNCSVPYPIYPPYQGMMPPMGMPMNYPQTISNSTTSQNTNNFDQQINNIEQEINNLDRRISNLENMYNSSINNNYSNSNYKMM